MSYSWGFVARTSSVVQATQLGENSEVGLVLVEDWCCAEFSRIGMSVMPTLKRGRRLRGGMLSTGSSGRRDSGTDEMIEIS